MKTIYMESTIALMANSGLDKEVAHLISVGVVHEKDQLKYLVVEDNENS